MSDRAQAAVDPFPTAGLLTVLVIALFGVIEFAGGGPGRAKRPTLAYDGLEIDIPFDRASASVETSAP